MKTSGKILALALSAALLPLGGCLRGCTSSRPPIHLNPNMDDQPKYLPQAESHFFYDGTTLQSPVPGTVARGELSETEEFLTGRSPWGFYVSSIPVQVTEELLARGKERYQIYCTPCHGGSGDGRGPVYERTGLQAADLRQERIRQLPDGQIYYVISNGFGLMPGYRYPIPPRHRWAIVAYLRSLPDSEASSRQQAPE